MAATGTGAAAAYCCCGSSAAGCCWYLPFPAFAEVLASMLLGVQTEPPWSMEYVLELPRPSSISSLATGPSMSTDLHLSCSCLGRRTLQLRTTTDGRLTRLKCCRSREKGSEQQDSRSTPASRTLSPVGESDAETTLIRLILRRSSLRHLLWRDSLPRPRKRPVSCTGLARSSL